MSAAEARGYARGWADAITEVRDMGKLAGWEETTLRARHPRPDAPEPEPHATIESCPACAAQHVLHTGPAKPGQPISIAEARSRAMASMERIEAAREAKPEPAAERCLWRFTGAVWISACGIWAVSVPDGTCLRCGKPIEVAGDGDSGATTKTGNP